MMEITLGKQYKLDYYSGEFQSGLTTWYNSVLDKTIDELSVADVSRMLRQNLLRDVAIKRAVDLFLVDPYDGEMQDGDLLSLLVSYGAEVAADGRAQILLATIDKLEPEVANFDWMSESSRMRFEDNLLLLRNLCFELL